MDPFTFISAMTTLMAADAQAAMSLMMQMSGGQLPANVADIGESCVAYACVATQFVY
jgi:hypothetical protein